jgi:uncharacterized coiled-coil DUF342 family protein
METNVVVERSLQLRLDEMTSRLELLGRDVGILTELRQLVARLQAERDQLRQHVTQLETERDQLQTERSRLLHAWADLAFTEEELAQAEKEPGGCSLAEIWERLEKV